MFDSPVVSVHIPPPLRTLAGGHAEITASGDTVGEILDAVANEYPAFRPVLRAADGSLAPGLGAGDSVLRLSARNPQGDLYDQRHRLSIVQTA